MIERMLNDYFPYTNAGTVEKAKDRVQLSFAALFLSLKLDVERIFE